MPSRRRWRRRDEERYRDVAWERRERILATPLIVDSLIGRGTAGGRCKPRKAYVTMRAYIRTRGLCDVSESRVLKISPGDVTLNTGYRLTREGGLMLEVERTRALTQPCRTICCDQSRSRASSLHAL
ncbi:hypothetical protein ALC62_00212 [Cyphomyrmex costatus]|uniref:Uncharacterized protein n=1 Tax=Cyphomyrmex costatus TaxID=456900 RepID=A0A195D7A3_9HYME|nr:hypothetical protein ALC62_00212 [Cyphomyrmex costatus]